MKDQSVLVINGPNQKGVTTFGSSDSDWTWTSFVMRKSDLLLGFRYKPLEMGFVVCGSVWGHRTLKFVLFFCSWCNKRIFLPFKFPFVGSLKAQTQDRLEEETLHLLHFQKWTTATRAKKHPHACFLHRCLQRWAPASSTLAEPSLLSPPLWHPLPIRLPITHLSWLLSVLRPVSGTWPGSPLALVSPSNPPLLPLFYIHLSFSSLTVASQKSFLPLKTKWSSIFSHKLAIPRVFTLPACSSPCRLLDLLLS